MAAPVQMINLIDASNAMRSRDEACREATESWRSANAQLAQLDQELAKCRDEEIVGVTGMADCLVAAGKAFIKRIVLHAEREQLCNQLSAASRELRSKEERDLIAALLEPGQYSRALLETDAQRFVQECAWHVDSCLEWQDECFDREDVESARAIGGQARRIVAAMREVYGAWPWTDLEAIEESWRQYRQGQLMDFETFKHELLKAAQ
jgi:hypothetical protein